MLFLDTLNFWLLKLLWAGIIGFKKARSFNYNTRIPYCCEENPQMKTEVFFFAFLLTEMKLRSIKTQKEQGQYSTFLNKQLFNGQKEYCFLRDQHRKS